MLDSHYKSIQMATGRTNIMVPSAKDQSHKMAASASAGGCFDFAPSQKCPAPALHPSVPTPAPKKDAKGRTRILPPEPWSS
ncbi:hypothetical protein IE81DRAFT_325475, partial [Ceraceosorus guamensis]